MKTIFLWVFSNIILIGAFAQAPRTTVLVNDSGGNMVKEIYLARADDESIKEGTYQQFFRDTLITRGRYSNNKKSGLWQFFDYSGKLNFSGSYLNDIKDGKWICTLNGKLSAEIYYSLGKTDSIFGFFENGNTAVEVWRYADGSGLIQTYYDNRNLKEIQPTLKGKPHGEYKVYFKNGRLHRDLIYENALMKTVITTFDMSGTAIDGGTLKDGNGSLVSYYLYDSIDNVDMKKYCHLGFTDGTLSGIASHYFENGKLESSGFTEKGFTVGEWKYYLDDGNIKHLINYNYSPFSDSKRQVATEIYSATTINTGQRNPEFQGGGEAWLEFLEKTVHYPNEAGDFPTLGIVYVDFTVSDIGTISSSRIVKSVNNALDGEALRVIGEMPRWNPGLSYGIPVSMRMNMPLSFNIE